MKRSWASPASPSSGLRKNTIIISLAALGIFSIGRAALIIQDRLVTRSLERISGNRNSEPDLAKTSALLKLASNSGVQIPPSILSLAYHHLVFTFGATNTSPTPVAWETTKSMLDYSSAVTPLPSRWIGPAPEVPGYKGLFGLTEMTNVRVFGSQKRVPLDVASRFTTFSAEEEIVELLRSRGYSTWPEFEMIVGGDGSNIVLDKMHLRNVVLKHMHVVYGGDVTVLENVTFIDCTFDFVRTERAIELGDLIIKREAVTLGP